MRFRNSQVGDANKMMETRTSAADLDTDYGAWDSRGPTAVARARDRKRRDHGVEGDHAREREEYDQG